VSTVLTPDAAQSIKDKLAGNSEREQRAAERAAQDGPSAAPASKPSRRELAEKAASEVVAPAYTPMEGTEWTTVPGGLGDVCVCLSAPNRNGKSYPYLVSRRNGRMTAIPLMAVYAAQDAGQLD